MDASDPLKETQDGKPPTLISTVFPTQANAVSIGAAVLGVLLIFVPLLFRQRISVEEYQANLLICVGIAVIMSAAGAQATFRVGSIVLAGAAAICAAFYFFLENERFKNFDTYITGTLYDIDQHKYGNLSIKFRHYIAGNYEARESQYDFVVFKKEMDNPLPEITFIKKENPEEDPISIKISQACFDEAFKNNQPLAWDYAESNNSEIIRDRAHNSAVIGRFGPPEPDVAHCAQETSSRAETLPKRQVATYANWGIFQAAQAAEAPTSENVPNLLSDLLSDDVDIRRSARDELALTPVGDMRRLLDAFHDQNDNYRLRLGLCVAFAEMLRLDKSKNKSIRGLLTDDDRNLLLDSAGDDDRTLRIYATEFLYDLADPRVTELALARTATSTEDTPAATARRYEWLYLAQTGWEDLTTQRKDALRPALSAVKSSSTGDPRIIKLLDKFT